MKTCQHLSETRNARRRGLTLVDVSVTVLIMGILAAVALPKYGETVSSMRAESIAARVVADFSLAKQRAEKTSSTITVQFYSSPDRYEITGLPDLNHPSQNYAVEVEAYPYKSVVNSAVFGGDAIITFDINGIPDSGGNVVLESGGYQKTVTVDANTGKVSVL